jgi:hypothetical protein
VTNSSPTQLLRPGLLAGVSLAVTGAGELGAAATDACRALGATVLGLGGAPADEEAVARALPDPLNVLVVDAAGAFAAGGLRGALDGAWVAIRAAGTVRMIAAGDGRVVLLSQRPGAGAHARATRDGLENLARTLSIEWSRHGLRVTAVHPGAATPAADVGALVAFLASPAGDYYSGCLFSLGGAVAPSPVRPS